MEQFAVIQMILIRAVPIVFAITLHEAAHGYVARLLGDNTAYMLGRVSLNPLRHIDPIGTVLFPLGSLLLGTGMLFGWAKPVPVNFSQLRSPKQDMLWVAAAGPAANFAMILFWAVVARIVIGSQGSLFDMAMVGIQVNATIMVLNLLPLPPLDGGRIAVSLLPDPLAGAFARIEPYGMMILVLLLFSKVLGPLIGPLVWGTVEGTARVFGLPL